MSDTFTVYQLLTFATFDRMTLVIFANLIWFAITVSTAFLLLAFSMDTNLAVSLTVVLITALKWYTVMVVTLASFKAGQSFASVC